jgi:hypothetical protein
MPSAKSLSAFLTASNITHTFRQSPGAHTWINWHQYLREVAPLLWPASDGPRTLVSATSTIGAAELFSRHFRNGDRMEVHSE